MIPERKSNYWQQEVEYVAVVFAQAYMKPKKVGAGVKANMSMTTSCSGTPSCSLPSCSATPSCSTPSCSNVPSCSTV